MTCAWQELLGVLPQWLSEEVDRDGRDKLQEIRLRLGQPPELLLSDNSRWLNRLVRKDDLDTVVNTVSKFSPWAAGTVSSGYLTAPGGHRIGLCGEMVVKDGCIQAIRQLTSLNIRVARDFPGIGAMCANLSGSILLLGPPGSGKTTLLRDLIRFRSAKETVCVVDQRGELFPSQFHRGKRVDVLTGCRKSEGIEILLRTMGPSTIAVDEITSEEDCKALVRAGWCGVSLMATAHAHSVSDLRERPVYRPLVETNLFDHILVLDREKHWRKERIGA